jgi:hypothetical protein
VTASSSSSALTRRKVKTYPELSQPPTCPALRRRGPGSRCPAIRAGRRQVRRAPVREGRAAGGRAEAERPLSGGLANIGPGNRGQCQARPHQAVG